MLIHLPAWLLESGRKVEHPEQTHRDTERMCTEMPPEFRIEPETLELHHYATIRAEIFFKYTTDVKEFSIFSIGACNRHTYKVYIDALRRHKLSF